MAFERHEVECLQTRTGYISLSAVHEAIDYLLLSCFHIWERLCRYLLYLWHFVDK